MAYSFFRDDGFDFETQNLLGHAGHDVSARDAYLRAALYYGAASESVDGLPDADAAITRLFGARRHCFDEYTTRLDRHAEHVGVPYGDTTLPGYFSPRATVCGRP